MQSFRISEPCLHRLYMRGFQVAPRLLLPEHEPLALG